MLITLVLLEGKLRHWAGICHGVTTQLQDRSPSPVLSYNPPSDCTTTACSFCTGTPLSIQALL